MSMNRFGIRLAAGLAIITIGCLAIFQAQRNSDAVDKEAWPDSAATAAAAVEPPTPLQLESDSLASLAPEDSAMLVRGNDPVAPQPSPADGPSSEFAFGNFPAASNTAAPSVAPAVATDAALASGDPAAGPASAASIRLASHDEAPAGPAGEFPFPQPLEPGSGSSVDGEPAAARPGTALDQASSEPEPLNAAADPSTLDPGQPSFGQPSFGQPSFGQPSFDGGAPELGASASAESEATADGEIAPGSELSGEPYAGDELSGEQFSAAGAVSDMSPASDNSDGSDISAASDVPVGSGAIGSGVTISPIDSQPVGSSLQMPQPMSAATASVPSQPAAESELAEIPSRGLSFGQSPQTAETPAEPSTAETSPRGSGGLQPMAPQGKAPASHSAAVSLQTVDATEVLAEPGERRLEGAQSPTLVIHKRAPEEVRVGRAADFIIEVKNVGTVAALDVRVFDSIPQGTRLAETVPQAAELSGLLCWQLGDLEPGGERTVTMKLVPEVEGELGSVARVTFEAAASVRTIATRPQLKLVQRAPEQVLIGQQLEIEVELSNVGSGTAAGVMLQADLAEGLQHPMGRQLDNLIGAMPPGDIRRQILRLQATAPGKFTSTIRLTGEDGVTAESSVDIEVISPALQVALSGPSLRYLERQTTYNVQVANSGTANASEIDIVAYLDRGLKFVSTEFEGQYDPNRHAVFWSLAELPAGQTGEVPLTLLPVEAGTHSVRLEAKADLGMAAASEKKLAIETLAELSFSIADDQDPIETGTETTYEVRVQNTGSRNDGDVQLKIQLPPGMELVSADPQAGTDGRGLVVFQPIARIDAKGEQTFRVRVRGAAADTHVIQAILTSQQSPKPVTKEESTTVYADQ